MKMFRKKISRIRTGGQSGVDRAAMDFARENGIDIRFGDPNAEDKPGENLILPKNPSYIKAVDADLDRFRASPPLLTTTRSTTRRCG